MDAGNCIKPTVLQLSNLHLSDINIDHGEDTVSRIVTQSHRSLRHLKLGYEEQIALAYDLNGSYDDKGLGRDIATHRLCTKLRENILILGPGSKLAGKVLLSLQSLHLIGFDYKDICVHEDVRLFHLEKLQSLSLESCRIGGFSELFNGVSEPPLNLRLKSFLLRHEDSDDLFLSGLNSFIRAFAGLEHLSLLLEGPGRLLSTEYLIKNHGATLKTLVFDQRTGPRDEWETDTQTDMSGMLKFIEAIAEGCSGLIELGLCLPTDADGYRYQVCQHEPRT